MEFKSPFSRIEAILQNILGADNVLEDPLSRAEVILLAILNDTEITEEFNYDELSELEALLYAIKESDEEYDAIPQTRSGKILLKILHGEKYEGETASRVEELLKEWSHTAAWYTKTVGPGNPINVTDALAEPAVGLKIDLSPIQASTPWIDTTANTAPYLLRPTETTGNTADEKLVGGSVVWNQIAPIVKASWSPAATTITGDSNEWIITSNADNIVVKAMTISFPINHVAFCSAYLKTNTEDSNIYAMVGLHKGGGVMAGRSRTNSNSYTLCQVIAKMPSDATINHQFLIRMSNEAPQGMSINAKEVICVDLTQMFANNPAIADYIYSLEQAEAGSGIAWLKSYGFFTKDYYPYNPGEIMSMKAFSKKVIGFNQLKDAFVLGKRWINGVYGDWSNNNFAASPQKIRCIPNTTYCISIPKETSMIYFYQVTFDIDGNYIKTNQYEGIGAATKKKTFTTDVNTYFFAFHLYREPVLTSTELEDICINLSDPNRNGEYEPYKEQTYELGNDELRGLFKLDTTTNKLYTDGDIKTSDGEIDRKYAIVDLGTLDWTYSDGLTQFYSSIISNDYPSGWHNKPVLCSKYIYDDRPYSNFNSPHIRGLNSGRVYIVDTYYTDAETFKAAMSGVYLIYELATPTTETSTPSTNPQDVYAGGTEEFVDERTVPIPVGHETIYSNVQEIIGYDGITITHGINETDPNPTEYQVLFQSMGTVYSGSLDVIRGVLTVDMAEVDLGTLNWSKATSGVGRFQSASITTAKHVLNSDIANIICSHFPTQSADFVYAHNGYIGMNDSDLLWVSATEQYADATTFKAAMSGTQLVYELATPITYNLTPIEVEMLLNSNYLKSDGGVITLTYKGTNPAILLMNKLRTKALMRKTKEIQNGNLQPILPNTKQL